MGVQCTPYNVCFFFYVWLIPVFLQYLMRAPSTFDSAPFFPVPIRVLNGDVPEIEMSSFPETMTKGFSPCKPCNQEGGARGMYQWEVMLAMNYKSIVAEGGSRPVSTMYPVLFASNDGTNWRVIADAKDVADVGETREGATQATHISAPLLVATLKNFGCVDEEKHVDNEVKQDLFLNAFPSKARADFYRWKLDEHIALHGSVNLVACVMETLNEVSSQVHKYATHCIQGGGGAMKCHLTPREALQKCFALGSACGQACGIFAPQSPHCHNGTIDPVLFEGLTKRRVRIKTSPGGGGAQESLVYCAQDGCKSGWHFKNMYVEAENPMEFMAAVRAKTKKDAHGFYVILFAVSDFHKPVHTFKMHFADDDDDDDDDKEDDKEDDEDKDDKHSKHHLGGHHLKDDVKEKDSDDDDEESKDHKDKKHTAKKHPKPKKARRGCVDLPGVRLSQIAHTDLISFTGKKSKALKMNAEKCTAACGRRSACKQSVWSQANGGCYLFKLATVEVNDFSNSYNSSYCGPAADKDLMMTMLHQAYKGYVPQEAPPAAPGAGVVRRLADGSAPPRRAQAIAEKLYWQIAHVPNSKHGVMKDQGAAEVRVIPGNKSCFTSPGFMYMVACMTSKPVYMNKAQRTFNVRPPPFNDRCLAVGGICGASCGSDDQVSNDAKRICPQANGRRLQGSLYNVAKIPRDILVEQLTPRRSATAASAASRMFFHLFIFFLTISYIATLLGKFPGNFTDFYPMHTWDEIRTHGYVLEKFGCAASCGCSASENKMTILRNWIGKISARPVFDDRAFPTFARWVDVFVDEGHREGARILWAAWTDFLDTDPPPDFIDDWAGNLQNMSWDQAATRSPFDLMWKDGGKADRKILPLHQDQAQHFAKTPGEEVPQGGVELAPDCLGKLKDLFEIFKLLPDNLKMDTALSCKDDVVLTRGVRMSVMEEEEEEGGGPTYTIAFSKDWRKELDGKVKQRAEKRSAQSKDQYQKSLAVVDKEGQTVDVFGKNADIPENRFPLHCREPPTRQDRQVIMIYVARARPEGDSAGVDKTRTLDKFLWACLRPKAVKRNSGNNASTNQKTPLLKSDRSWSSVTGAVVRNVVEGVLERQHEEFGSTLTSKASEKSSGRGPNLASLHKSYFSAYSKYRTVDSDWEMARLCYGQVVGEGKDVDGEEVLILDNPSPALLELISDIHSENSDIKKNPGLGLVSSHNVEEQSTMCGISSMSVHSYAAKPTLDFMFGNSNGKSLGSGFENEFRKQLAAHLADNSLDLSRLKFQERKDGMELIVEVSGPGRLIELIRANKISSIQVQNMYGRMFDNHPTVIVKRDLLAPYMGVRGKSGGLNYAVDLLQMREGFIGTGEATDSTPDRMLFGIFDARHQPHPDFWRKCLPKFMNNTEFGYTYEVNDAVTLVQAPQSFALVAIEEDILDVLNGMTFNIMNVIRNRCGGVTSCGTNAVWQIDAREFTRTGPDDDRKEYFDSRTKIEDTASTHMLFCKGKRSVYVQETVSTGIAKLNSDYLCAMQRWAEGAVQLFWIQLFKDKTRQLIFFGIFVLSFLSMILYTLYGYSPKEIIGYNIYCDVEGTPTLLLGTNHPFCMGLYNIFSTFTLHTNDKIMFQMAIHEYMRLVDFALTWLLTVSIMAGITMILAVIGYMPKVVRVFIMMENISYWLTSCSIFFWTSLTLYMIVGGDPPLMFNVTHFMMFVLLMNIAQHAMINEYKSLGGCDETSIWRAQQSYTLAAPLYVLAIIRGTGSAWGIIWNRLDKSFWTSADHGQEIVVGVTLWVTFIWVSFVTCLVYFISVEAKHWLLSEMGDHVQKQCQLGALCMLGLLALTVWEPFLSLWGLNNVINRIANDRANRPCSAWVCSLLVWWRGRAWIMRYIIDFGMPLLVFSGALGGGVSILNLVTYASTVHGFRS